MKSMHGTLDKPNSLDDRRYTAPVQHRTIPRPWGHMTLLIEEPPDSNNNTDSVSVIFKLINF